MGTTVFPLIWRRLAVRPFKDRDLEHEFRQAFRSAGVRFFEIGAAVSGLAYLAFFVIFAISGTSAPLAQPQPLRIGMFLSLIAAAAFAKSAKPVFARHY